MIFLVCAVLVSFRVRCIFFSGWHHSHLLPLGKNHSWHVLGMFRLRCVVPSRWGVGNMDFVVADLPGRFVVVFGIFLAFGVSIRLKKKIGK